MAEFDVSGFLVEFFDEARQRLQSINQKLVLFESGKLDEKGLIQLRRDVHTIKGSAQMLGVQDVGKLAHLFEDAIDCAIQRRPAQRQPVIQFLYDLHDSLQHRLQDVDGKSQLDTDAMLATFEPLKQTLDIGKDSDQEKVDKVPQQRRKKKRPRVPKNLISAVMGSIEESLQDGGDKDSAVTDASREETKSSGSGSDDLRQDDPIQDVKPAAPIDFRPELERLEMDTADAGQESGDFLRVDRTRLSRLSNQIIELGSGRYRETFPEQQLQQVVQGFRSLKEALMADGVQPAAGAWQRELEHQLRQIKHLNESMRAQQRRSTVMLDDLRDQVLGLMLRPLSTVFSVFPRAVRDIGMRCGKKVQLLVAGDVVEMDQVAAEALTEALIHLINNAVAHGIESPEERLKRGKLEHGQITITATQKSSDVEITVMDDGQGLDVDLIADEAVAKGIVSQQEIAEMDTSEIMELIFQPGFSTCHDVSDIAGRGMGVTVVQDVINTLTGTIHIHSQKGQGSQFCLTIPVTVAVQQAVLFNIAGHRFGMLSNLVNQVLPFSAMEIKKGHGPYSNGYIDLEHHRVPIIDLHDALGRQIEVRFGHDQSNQEKMAHESSVMVVEHLDGFLGIVVDEILDKQEILLREVSPYLKQYQPVGLMGCAIAADGDVLLLIDPNGLKQMWRSAPDPELAACNSGEPFNHRMMLVDDSSIALKIEKSMFEAMGFKVDTAIGGKDALEKIGLHHYDVLVTDLEMPDIDGVQLAEQLRSEGVHQHMPVLVLATLESEYEQQRALAAGANAYLVKHRMKDEEEKLLSTLSSLLGAGENPHIDEPD